MAWRGQARLGEANTLAAGRVNGDAYADADSVADINSDVDFDELVGHVDDVPARDLCERGYLRVRSLPPRDSVHCGGARCAAAVLLECEHARGEWRHGVGGWAGDGGSV